VRSLAQLVTVGGALSATLSTVLVLGIPESAAATPAPPGDFNGDGFRDLASDLAGEAGSGLSSGWANAPVAVG
jgi:hypothetical protein